MKFTPRLAFYLLIAIALMGIVWLFFHTPDAEHSRQSEGSKTPSSKSKPGTINQPGSSDSTPPPISRAVDPEVQKLADLLASRTESPQRDLEIVHEFIGYYNKAFHGNPVGLNEDITAALTGQNPKQGMLFPANSSVIVNGQLVDHWGSPYWFHPETSTKMEIRSAGPDKSLFTNDDVILVP